MAGMPVLLTGNLDRAGGVLFTSPAIDAVGTGRARHQLLMHPEDLEERGIADGATVEVTSRVGTVGRASSGRRRSTSRGCPSTTSPTPSSSTSRATPRSTARSVA